MTLRRFLKWWGRELATLVPVGMRPDHHKRLDTLELEMGVAGLNISRRAGRKLKVLGRLDRHTGQATEVSPNDPEIEQLRAQLQRKFKPEKTNIALVVPRQQVLTKVISLPLAAEENLRSVLGYEMNRVSPFKAEDVYFDGKITQRTPATKRLEVTLHIAPRSILREALTLIGPWDHLAEQRDTQITLAENHALITLVPPMRSAKLALRLNALLLVANLAALAAFIALPLIEQSDTLKRLDTELEQIKEIAVETSQLRDRLTAATQAAAYLDDIKNAKPSAVVLLESLSKHIPDTTWLNRLEIKEQEVHVAGFSASASALIARLERAEGLAEVRFVSPVSQDPRTGKERFHLGAKIVKAGDD